MIRVKYVDIIIKNKGKYELTLILFVSRLSIVYIKTSIAKRRIYFIIVNLYKECYKINYYRLRDKV